ncbi:uncharacterized protein LOC108738138 isoform X2 [Agrilus planipennis]|uniref:Uncharacterized protein LOC108738138 isoform X2 n=1 Tax=Agrilus planipennis TaxID=224129 RepID=A0A1W4X3J4_AGRPL|nr:uncharacterized protein LOC108738138 isoform X2 [Agrilus planipennis]
MYYLVKFCRICIQTDRKLLDIESLDYDSIKLSEKLKTCTQMVISEESLSTKICTSCIQKLRISYQFHSMCKKSTTILQHHLTELLRGCENLDADKFVNCESLVTLPPSQKVKRKRNKRKSFYKSSTEKAIPFS